MQLFIRLFLLVNPPLYVYWVQVQIVVILMEEIEQRIDSLGYVLMDEASGNFYGKQLIRAYYF